MGNIYGARDANCIDDVEQLYGCPWSIDLHSCHLLIFQEIRASKKTAEKTLASYLGLF